MTKRWRIIAIVVLLFAIALILVGATRRAPRFGDRLALLRNIPSSHTEDKSSDGSWVIYSTSGLMTGDYKIVKEIYRVREPFVTFNEKAKKELKPLSHEASSYPPKKPDVTIYNTNDPKNHAGDDLRPRRPEGWDNGRDRGDCRKDLGR